ncbi:MAG: sensor histidine kinase, partial [Planctomycetota bacterium]
GLLGQAMSSNMELAGLYAELAEYKSLLEKKNRELVEVNQLISHDLGKPLTVFKTVMGLLLGDHLGDLGPKQRDAVQNALEATHYMEELIGDILEASRLDYDGFQFKFESIDMTLLIGSLIRRLRFHLEEQRVRVRVEPLPVIQGDQCALQKVFMNLIGNAASYRDLEKDISLITIAASQSGADWIFEVRDNGVGIPEDSHDRIFKKFCRGSNTGSISGTGLGLYIVREYARGHGGEVTVESKVGEGTTFFVRIPQEPTQALHSPVA